MPNFIRLLRLAAPILTLSVLLGSLLPLAVQAASGDSDLGFRQTVVGDIFAIAEQPDGRILVGGNLRYQNGSAFVSIVRCHPDGSSDASFQVTTNGSVMAIVLDSQGGIYIGGSFSQVNGQPQPSVARLFPDGTLDSSFMLQSVGNVNCMALLSDGRLLVGAHQRGIYRVSSTGAIDTDYAVTLTGSPWSLCVQNDGGVIVGGDITSLNGSAASHLLRLTSAGVRDTAWNCDAGNVVYALTQDAQGNLLVGGSFTTLGGVSRSRLARVSSTGVVDSTFNPAPNGSVYSILSLANGQYIAGGSFSSAGGASRTGVVCLNASGTADLEWVNPGLTSVRALCLQRSGDLLAGKLSSADSMNTLVPSLRALKGGGFTSRLQFDSPDMVSWVREGFTESLLMASLESSPDHGASWLPVGPMTRTGNLWQAVIAEPPDGTVLRAKGYVTCGMGNASGQWVHSYVVKGPATPEIRVRLEGGSELVDGTGTLGFYVPKEPKRFIIENIGNAPLLLGNPGLRDLSSGVSDPSIPPFQLNLQAFKSVLAPGEATSVGILYTPPISPNASRFGTLFFPTNDQDELDFDIALAGADFPSSRSALSAIELRWIGPGGSFSRTLVNHGFHPEWPFYTMTIPANLMNAELWLWVGESDPFSRVTFMVNGQPFPFGGDIAFSRAGSQQITITSTAPDGVTTSTYQITVQRAVAKAGDVDLNFQSRLSNGSVRMIAPQPDGSLIVGGSFSSIGGQPRVGLAKMTEQGSVAPDYVPASASPNSLLTGDDGSLLMAGQQFGTQRGFARFLSSGQVDSSLPGSVTNGLSIRTIILDGDGFWLAGSSAFALPGETTGRHIRRFTWDGRPDLAFYSNVTSPVLAMARLPDGRFLVGQSDGAKVCNRFGDIGLTVHISGSVNCILPLPQGGYLLGGSFFMGSPAQKLIRLKPDLTHDTAFTHTGVIQGTPTTLALQTDGKILLSNCSIQGGTNLVRTTGVVRLLSNGQQDTSFATELQSIMEVNSLTLRKDGQLLVGGRFSSVNDVPDANLTLLINDPATESLEVASRNQVTWLRGGSSPEALRTRFALSRDGGMTWMELGPGQRISGGWLITGLALPAKGRIRARADISVGLGNNSTGIIESIKDYDFEGEEITVLNDLSQSLNSGVALEFGDVGTGLGAKRSLSVTIHNDGSASLTGVRSELSGEAAADFTLTESLPASLAPGMSQVLTLNFSPKGLGTRQAVITLFSSDGDEPTFTLTLQGSGVASSPFTVVTGAATQITASSVLLQGTAKANAVTRQMYFDYGETASLGQSIVASPNMIAGIASANVSAALTGLRPGVTYHYRIRGESPVGNAVGSTRTFRTPAGAVATGIQVSGPIQSPPEGTILTLDVVAPEQTWWSVTGLPTWITATLPTVPGPGSLVLKVLPNSGASTRKALLKLGGASVTITQTAVISKPVITPSNLGRNVRVNDAFAQQISIGEQPGTLTIKGLPPGLTLSADGWVRGVFDLAGDFTSTLTARNAKGTSTVQWSFQVAPFYQPMDRLPGGYIGLIQRDPILNRNLASRFEMTVTSSGAYSGKIITGTTPAAFAGRLVLGDDGADFTATLPFSGGIQKLTGTLLYSPREAPLRLRLQNSDGSATSYFYGWKTDTSYVYSANLALVHSRTDLDVPFGSGYLTCTSTKTSKGVGICTGRLADGTPLTFSSPMGAICLYQSMPQERGSFAGFIVPGASTNTATWLKLPPVTPLPQDAYAVGFGPVELAVPGGIPAAMTPGSVRPGATATLSFSHSTLNLTETSFTVPFQVVNPSTKGLTNTAKFTAATNPNTVAMPTYNPVTGAFTGTFTLKGATTASNRKVTFQGLLVPVGTGFVGHGYFMLPASTAKNAPQTSGRVSMTIP